jgi:hypothetical protein
MVNDDHTALMIIRAWIEPGSSEPLRAQIRISTDVSAGIERTLTLARPEAVCATVQSWLAEIVSRADTGGTQPDPTAHL